jgi:DNA-binding SARP family transcriptional activator/tetratricopeptide (TPR) repeat protein
MLLLAPRQQLPLSRLVDALWAQAPPLTAKNQVQICVSALRHQLADAGEPEAIVTCPTGYLINVADDSLDLKQFELLVARGRQSMALQQVEKAVDDLRAALSLWRGPALDGVESPVVRAAATHLNEERMNVTEERIDIELRLGRHRQLIGELGELVARYPYRERLRAMHMLALYRAGRQADALDSFRAIRRVLSVELGLVPGEELCALEQAILVNDETLDLGRDPYPSPYPGGPLVTAAPVAPHQLPAAPARLSGRDEIIERLRAHLSPAASPSAGLAPRRVPVAVLTGKGGIGKTALALHVGHLLSDDYPDGQLFADLEESRGRSLVPADWLERFLRALGVPPTALPEDLAEQSAAYRSILAGRRVLIVLDAAASIGQVMPLIPGNWECAVIITSRYPLAELEGARYFDVGDLDEASSLGLLAEVIGADRIDAEEEAARELARLCGFMPLALRLAASKIAGRRHWTISKLVARLADEARRLDELELRGVGIRATFHFSYHNLHDDARRLFRRLSLLGLVDFSSWVCAPLLDADAATAANILDSLVEVCLVEVRDDPAGAPRYCLHGLIRIYALERLTAEESTLDRTAALHRLLGCWLFLATEAHHRAYGGRFAILHGTAEHWRLPAVTAAELLEKPLDWFRLEHAGLVAAISQAAHAGVDDLCWDLAISSVTLFETGYHLSDWRSTNEIALAAARHVGNSRGEAAMLYSLGYLALTERQPVTAARQLAPAFLLFKRIGDVHGCALTVNLLAYAKRLNGDHRAALSQYRKALAGFREAKDKVSEVDSLTSMAQIYLDMEDYGNSEELLRQALGICRHLDGWRITAQTQYRLGEFLLRRGELQRAESTFESVLRTVRVEGDLVGEAYALQGLGTVRLRQGRYQLAEEILSSAVRVSRQLSDGFARGGAVVAFTDLLLQQERYDVASMLINEALGVFGRIGWAAVWRARFLGLQGRVEACTGKLEAARESWQAALELAGSADTALVRQLTAALASLGKDASTG